MERGGHLSGPVVANRLKRPTRFASRSKSRFWRATLFQSSLEAKLLGLAPGGVYPASEVTLGAVVSYFFPQLTGTTFSPLPP